MKLVELLHTNRAAVVSAWRKRVASLPASDAPSPLRDGPRVVEWLAHSIEGPETETATETPPDLRVAQDFGSPRAIAELAFLVETIDEMVPAQPDDAVRTRVHRVIDGAIARSVAREMDESERVRKRLRLAADVTFVGSWELAPETGIIDTDARSRELFGTLEGESETVEALTWRLHDDDRTRVRTALEGTAVFETPYIDECRTVQPDGTCRWIAIAAAAHQTHDAKGPIVLGIVHDITIAKRAEEEHARVVEELSRAVHISEMFVGILSHDLRNPLGAILGGAQLLALTAQDDRDSRVLKLVVSSGQRMGRMIEQLLDFTRARLGEGIPLQRETIELADVARDVVEEGKASGQGSLLRHTARGDTQGMWDRDRVSQIVSNLVGNALQHGAARGAIDVVVDGTDAQHVTLSVQNEGTIPADLVPVIFNPFRGTLQKRGASRGLGLGLYVARQIALAHGGELTVATTPVGTTFTLTLPRGARPTPPPRALLARDEELAAFEQMAAQPSVSAVTAKLFGATPLHERVPLEHADIVERYASLLDKALDRKTFRGEGEGLADALRAIAERLGELDAGPREITDVHARALRRASHGTTAARTQALLVEGRLLALEMMGNLASYYRRRARGQVRAPVSTRTSR